MFVICFRKTINCSLLEPWILNLKRGVQYDLADMAVTSDNKLLLCNCLGSNPKIYIYKDCKDYEAEISLSSQPYCITVVPCTDTAVVTLQIIPVIIQYADI
jgi:hypothetical protein